MLSSLLLILGLFGFLGSAVIGRFVEKWLHLTLAILPAIMAAVAATLALLGGHHIITIILLAIWGLAASSAPVGWWTWLTRAAPEDSETGGGRMIAAIQLAITLGAMVGGIAYDVIGPVAAFLGSGVILCAAALVAYAGVRLASGVGSPVRSGDNS